MGLDLGSLASLNPLSVVADAVKGVVGEIIPGPVGKLVGDVAAGVVDYETGNLPGMLKDGMSALTDLPQVMQATQQSHGVAKALSEPAAPPTRTPASPAGSPPSADATAPPGAQGGLGGLLLKVLDPLGLFSKILGGAGGAMAFTQSKLVSSDAAAPTTSTKDPTTADGSGTAAAKASTTKASTKESTAKTTAEKTTAASGGSKVDPSTLSKDDFMALGNEAFMQAVVQGKIPKEIADSPAAMQSLQARMNAISEMNQLMTSMLSAVHQMEMSVIQNVRV